MDNSWRTAISRAKPSSAIQWVENRHRIESGDPTWSLRAGGYFNENNRILDYGCGRGFDADYMGAEKYDPYWFPVEPEGEFDVIFCTYVLNVMDRPAQTEVLRRIATLLSHGGVSYVTVRRDIPWGGIDRDGYRQTYVLNGDMREAGYFSAFSKKNAYQIYVRSEFGDY